MGRTGNGLWPAHRGFRTCRKNGANLPHSGYLRSLAALLSPSMFVLLLLLVAAPLASQDVGLTPFQEQKALALLRDQLPCLGCHELGGDGGHSAPSLSTVGQRRSAAYIRAIVNDPQSVVPGAAMPKTPMPPGTRDLIVKYLGRGARSSSSAES